MYTKTCPQCNQPSFSSSKLGKWNCPICQTELSSLLARDAGELFPEVLTKKYPTTHQSHSDYISNFETYI
ncbi:hypothetical protein [Bacillus sp. JJ1562]|uniref:hypothetical protein n=1 Tax=Bacillus sp. JJ1562 TaxID=3122960 RepID=UPI0030033995